MTRNEEESPPSNPTLLGLPLPPPPQWGADLSEPTVLMAGVTGETEVRPKHLTAGTVIHDRYRIERTIGVGGMATVYLAKHVEIGASVAIKVMHESLARVPAATESFLAEARAVSAISNPHVVSVTDYGRLEDGVPFMVMEYLQGDDLDACVLRDGPMPWTRVRTIALQICEALGAAHRAGVVHRDVKPHNCLRQSDARFGDFIKVLDFGIASMSENILASTGTTLETTPNAIVGTPEYMAPEQARQTGVDHRVDIYALGVTMFVLLTGRLPFLAEKPVEQMAQHMYESPPAPSEVREGLDPRIDAVLLKALAKDPDDRFPTMEAFARAIESLDHDWREPFMQELDSVEEAVVRPHRRARAALHGAVLLGCGVAVTWLLWNGLRGPGAPSPEPVVVGATAAPVPAPSEPPASAPDQDPAPQDEANALLGGAETAAAPEGSTPADAETAAASEGSTPADAETAEAAEGSTPADAETNQPSAVVEPGPAPAEPAVEEKAAATERRSKRRRARRAARPQSSRPHADLPKPPSDREPVETGSAPVRAADEPAQRPSAPKPEAKPAPKRAPKPEPEPEADAQPPSNPFSAGPLKRPWGR